MKKRTLQIIENDTWLKPYEKAIFGRYEAVKAKEAELTQNWKMSLSDFATGYLYFGLHKTKSGWVFREWAPHATAIYLIGTFSFWAEQEEYKMKRLDNGVWELFIPENTLNHEDIFKLKIYWDGGCGERLPAWANRVVQDPSTNIFSAQVWNPISPYKFKNKNFRPKKDPLLIYECHVGMAQEEEKVGSYKEFQDKYHYRVSTSYGNFKKGTIKNFIAP